MGRCVVLCRWYHCSSNGMCGVICFAEVRCGWCVSFVLMSQWCLRSSVVCCGVSDVGHMLRW